MPHTALTDLPTDGLVSCPIDHVLSIVEGRWATLIVRDLLSGPKRFGELKTSLGEISPKTLTERLRHLERHGMVTRHAYAEVPPRVEYRLTERGRSLEPILVAMYQWGAEDLRG